MKKALTYAALTSMAVTGVVAVAPAGQAEAAASAKPGFYNIATKEFKTTKEFKQLTKAEKAQWINNNVFILGVDGKVVSFTDLMDDTITDKELDASAVTLATFEANKGVNLGEISNPTAPTELKVESVSAINAYQVEITFNQAVDVTTGVHGALNPDNLYIGIKDDVTNKKLSALASNGEYVLLAGSDYNKDKKTGTKVILEAKDASDLFFDSTVLGTKKGEEVTFEFRNIESATGKSMNNQAVSFKIGDTIRPTVAAEATSIEPITSATDVVFLFSEPVKGNGSGKLNTGGEVYLNGNKIASSNVSIENETGTFDEARTVNVNIASLPAGKHTFTFVGVRDLNNNLLNPNPTSVTITVAEKSAEEVIPVVQSIKQVDDNAIIFTTNTPVATNKGQITIEKVDGTNDVVVDLAAGKYAGASNTSDFVIDQDTSYNAADKVYAYRLTLSKATNAVTVKHLSYNGADQILRTFVIENLVSAAPTADVQKTKFTKTITLTKDLLAPTVDEKVAVNASLKTLTVTFKDEPFGKAVTLDNNKVVTIKYVKDGKTFQDTLTTTELGTIANNKLTLDISGKAKLLDASSDLVKGAEYSIILPDGIVHDGNKVDPGNNLDPARPHNFVEKTLTVTIPGSSTDYEVPQVSNATADITQPAGNSNSFAIKLHGKDVKVSTVLDKSNYKWNGATLPTGTNVSFVGEPAGSAFDGTIYITLPKNSVQFAGNYPLEISGITTEAGYKMLTTEINIVAVDDFSPTIQSAQINSSNELLITFSESLTTSMTGPELAQAINNIAVTVGSTPLAVSKVDEVTGNNKQLKITTATNFNVDAMVTVAVVKDINGNIVIKDANGNYAAPSSVTATKKQ